MKLAFTYLVIISPWIIFTAWAMHSFSPHWGWLLVIPAMILIRSK